jgi:hypothetical protein
LPLINPSGLPNKYTLCMRLPVVISTARSIDSRVSSARLQYGGVYVFGRNLTLVCPRVCTCNNTPSAWDALKSLHYILHCRAARIIMNHEYIRNIISRKHIGIRICIVPARAYTALQWHCCWRQTIYANQSPQRARCCFL